jgi:hypothetical protein
MTPSHGLQNQSLFLEEYSFLREEIRHQDNLINARLSWLVSSQPFLLSGFAVTLNGSAQSLLPIYAKLNLILVNSLPVAGLVTDFASYLTIWAAISRMKNIRHIAGISHPPHLPPVQADRQTRRLGLSGPILIPLVFLAVWLAILVERWMF